MSGRVFWLVVLLGGIYAWQHQYEIKRWWIQQNAGSAGSQGVEVYTAKNCTPCEQAIDFLRQAGKPVTVHNIDEDEAALSAFKRAGGGGMPLIVDGWREMRGFNAQLLNDWYVQRPIKAHQLDQLGVYAAGEPRIPILYGTDWCPYCAKARQYFAENSIAYRDLDIERDSVANGQHKALGFKGVPVIVYEDMVWSGFSVESMEARRKWAGK